LRKVGKLINNPLPSTAGVGGVFDEQAIRKYSLFAFLPCNLLLQ